MKFLNRIANEIIKNYSDINKNIIVIFPNKRSGIYLKKYLQLNSKKPIWMPAIYSIEEFLLELTNLKLENKVSLIFKLYNIYSKYAIGKYYSKTFDDFYLWGRIILNDFSDWDKWLVNTNDLFNNLERIKEITDLNINEHSEIYKKYTSFWIDLGNVYKEFKNSLLKDKLCYEGMLFREIAENIQDYNFDQFDTIIFAGFNALTKSEQKIIEYLYKNHKNTLIYLDLDSYFINNSIQEAGIFYRTQWKDIIENNEVLWIDNYLIGDENYSKKNIYIYETNTNISMVKLFGIVLKNLFNTYSNNNDFIENSVIVLPDQSLLFPILNSIPDDIKEINISMGYPLKLSHIHNFLNLLFDIQKNIIYENNEILFYYEDLLKIFESRYLRDLVDLNKINKVIYDNKKVYVNLNSLEIPDFIKELLVTTPENNIVFLNRFIDFIKISLKKFKKNDLEIDFAILYLDFINNIIELMKNYNVNLKTKALRNLLNDIITDEKIPFVGEPLKGIQVIGFLETQNIDFDNVFILSMNEGIIPFPKSDISIIPYDLKKTLNLPLNEFKEAIYSYYFYRLLKRTKNLYLFYTVEANDSGKIERSRYIEQLINEYSSINEKVKLNIFNYNFNLVNIPQNIIEIEKNDYILNYLSFNNFTFSATNLFTYIECALKFYFDSVLKLKEQKRILKIPDEATFGSIIHDSLYELFKGYLDTLFTKDIVEKIKLSIENVVKKHYIEKIGIDNIDKGYNYLLYKTAIKLIQKFLESNDIGLRKIKNLEYRLKDNIININNYNIKISGRIDRIEYLDNVYYIMDYKTGEVNSLNLEHDNSSYNELLDYNDAIYKKITIFKKIKSKKELFQLLCYGYLYFNEIFDKDIKISLGIYNLKKNSMDLVKVNKLDIFKKEDLEFFKYILISILNEIFNKNIPFYQNIDKKVCNKCEYNYICNIYY